MMDKPTKCEDYLHLVNFPYNNSYHVSLKMSPFEVLLIEWDNPIGMTNKVKQNMKTTYDIQKRYAYLK